MSLCHCGRAPRGFQFVPYIANPGDKSPIAPCCSMECLDIAVKLRGKMQPNPDEIAAVRAASPAIGDYLEKIGKSDLAEMSEAEWYGFLEHAYTAICGEVRAAYGQRVPF